MAASCLATSLPVIHFDSDADEIDDGDEDGDEADEVDYSPSRLRGGGNVVDNQTIRYE